MKTKDIFFSLLRNALWHTAEELPQELTANAADRLFRIAEEQTVSALIADAIIRNDIRMPQY